MVSAVTVHLLHKPELGIRQFSSALPPHPSPPAGHPLLSTLWLLLDLPVSRQLLCPSLVKARNIFSPGQLPSLLPVSPFVSIPLIHPAPRIRTDHPKMQICRCLLCCLNPSGPFIADRIKARLLSAVPGPCSVRHDLFACPPHPSVTLGSGQVPRPAKLSLAWDLSNALPPDGCSLLILFPDG